MRRLISSSWLFSAILLSVPNLSQAAITVTGVQGASAFNIVSGTAPTIHGGVAGQCANFDNINTCNSCANAAGLTVCNRTRIYGTLQLQISFTSSSASGRPYIAKGTSNEVIQMMPTNVNQGQTATIVVRWGKICNNFETGSSANCESTTDTRGAGSFKVGIDSNNNGAYDAGDDLVSIQIQSINPDPGGVSLGALDTIDDCATNNDTKPGICQFMAYPGDQKVFFEDAQAGSGFPSTTSGTINRINVYAASQGFITSPGQVEPYTLTVEQTTDGFDIVNKIIDGLDNGEPIYFRVSSVDQAGNEMYFTSDTAIQNLCGGTLNPNPPFDGTGGGTSCPFAAIPDTVVGFLNKDMNCFIATAAYDSPFHPLVDDLREFRNRFLNPYKFGRKFVNWYYSWSPDAAHWLRHHDWPKGVVRALLLPIWLLTRALIWWPMTLTAVVLLMALRQRRTPAKVVVKRER